MTDYKKLEQESKKYLAKKNRTDAEEEHLKCLLSLIEGMEDRSISKTYQD